MIVNRQVVAGNGVESSPSVDCSPAEHLEVPRGSSGQPGSLPVSGLMKSVRGS